MTSNYARGSNFITVIPSRAEDVQFSFERFKGAGSGELKRKVQAIEVLNAHHIRFRLHEPWPDFMTFYGTPATGAGWIVPKNYTLKVGEAEFKNHPIGLGPYRFVSHQPGVEVVLEANTDYWRKVPHVKRLVMKSVPDATTRLAMLKKREADITNGILGARAEEVEARPKLKVEAPVIATQWIIFTYEQYHPNFPWFDQRVRLAANLAFNRQTGMRRRPRVARY